MARDAFGRYRVVRELGRGAMGRVFLAHDPEIDREVAVKTIQIFDSVPDAERSQARARFLGEARSAGKLSHPGIVTIFDVGEADGAPWLAMEFVQGETLDAFCRTDTLLPVETVVELVAGVAETLAYAHAAGIVHRDVKPANLMRVSEHAVKIMDFGLAKSAAAAQATHDGALLGTPNYMAPEQIRGDRADARTDLWALGVVLFEMLTGEKPFAGDSVSSVLFRIVNEPARDIEPHLGRVSPPLGVFLRKALAKAPEERYQDGRSFAAALREAASGDRPKAIRPASVVGAAPASSIPPREAPPPRRSLTPWIAGVTIVLAGLVAAGAYWHRLREEEKAANATFDVSVRAEPADVPVFLDGRPVEGGVVTVRAAGPFGTLTASRGCRQARREITSADAGGQIVLVLDPEKASVLVDPGVEGGRVRLNDEAAAPAPRELDLDLCRENRIEAQAPGFTPASVVVPSGATPLEARNAVSALRLSAIPTGRVVVSAPASPVAFLVDGKKLTRDPQGFELTAGRHEIRAVDEATWIDVRKEVDVPAGGSVEADLAVPPLAELVVQAFPPNAKVYLRRKGGAWKYLDDVPVDRRIAAGPYEVKVEFGPTGETKESKVNLRPGENAPLRFAFESKP